LWPFCVFRGHQNPHAIAASHDEKSTTKCGYPFNFRVKSFHMKNKINRIATGVLTVVSVALTACAPAPIANITCNDPQPIYPSMSFKQGEEGEVLVKMQIGADGMIADANVIKSSGYPRLDAAALKAARETRCVPFLPPKQDEPVSVVATKPFSFRLNLAPIKTPQ
jgi:TonB family protein